MTVCGSLHLGSCCGSAEGTVQPALCPAGHYCPPGSTLGREFPCPIGTVQSQPGASSSAACLPCPPGMELIYYDMFCFTLSCFWLCSYLLQGVSVPPLVCPSQLDCVRQDFTVQLAQLVRMQPLFRSFSPSLFPCYFLCRTLLHSLQSLRHYRLFFLSPETLEDTLNSIKSHERSDWEHSSCPTINIFKLSTPPD